MMNNLLRLSTKVRPSQQQTSLSLSGKEVILQQSTGIYFGLNESGTVLWNAIKAGGKTIFELKELMLNHFNIPENQCEHDLVTLLNQLHDEGLVTIIE